MEQTKTILVGSATGLLALSFGISAAKWVEERNCSECNFSIYYTEFGRNFVWCPAMFKRMPDNSTCYRWAKPPEKKSDNFIFFTVANKKEIFCKNRHYSKSTNACFFISK